jgi:hypothetical protein
MGFFSQNDVPSPSNWMRVPSLPRRCAGNVVGMPFALWDGMQILSRFIAILLVGASFLAFTTMKVGAVDSPGIVPPPFPAPAPLGFPAPIPPKPMPNFPGPGETGNASGGTGNAQGGAPSGGAGGFVWGATGGISSSGIH